MNQSIQHKIANAWRIRFQDLMKSRRHWRLELNDCSDIEYIMEQLGSINLQATYALQQYRYNKIINETKINAE